VSLRQKIVTVELPNNGSGFGFSVVSDGERGGAVVHSIVEGGIAEMVRGERSGGNVLANVYLITNVMTSFLLVLQPKRDYWNCLGSNGGIISCIML